MIDLLFQIALSNVCISLALAILAVVVGVTLKRPALAHLLWLLVFVKLLTPPIVTIPVVTIPWQADTTSVAIFDNDGQQDAAAIQVGGSEKAAFLSAETWSVVLNHVKPWLSLSWLLGSLFVFVWSLLRVYRFRRLLGKETEVGAPELQAAATKIGSRLGLRATPTIYTTSAHLSPMVWWIGGKVWVVIPAALLDQMDTRQFQWILAHELAHVRRRDYLVRWIEWLACVCFWWNPVVWWARYNLRANEELCCDAIVVSSLKPKPHTYGDSLLKAVEILACPPHRPPSVASEINSGEYFERRFKMIVSKTSNRLNSRWLQACVLLLAVAILPLGLAIAGEGQRDAGIENQYKEIGVSTEMLARIRDLLRERGLSTEQTEQALRGMLRVIHEVRSEGEEFEMDPRLRDYFGEIGLTDEQIELVQNLARRIVSGMREREAEMAAVRERIGDAIKAGRITEAQGRARWEAYLKRVRADELDAGIEGHYKEIGVSTEMLARIRDLLRERGLSTEQTEQALRGMLRVIHEVRSEGEEFEMDPRLRDYFGEIGLTDEQIELVQRIARRVLHSQKDSDR